MVSYTKCQAVPLRVTRRLGWRSDIVGCQGCGGPAWHWLDASPGMTLARSWGKRSSRCVATRPTPCCLTPRCQRKSDGSTLLGSPTVSLSMLHQYVPCPTQDNRLWAGGDLSPQPYACEAHALPTELRRQLRFIVGGLMPYIDVWGASQQVTTIADSNDVACPSSVMSLSSHPST